MSLRCLAFLPQFTPAHQLETGFMPNEFSSISNVTFLVRNLHLKTGSVMQQPRNENLKDSIAQRHKRRGLWSAPQSFNGEMVCTFCDNVRVFNPIT